MKTTIKYIVHYEDYGEFKECTKTYRILDNALEFLKDRRESLYNAFERNGMQFTDGEKITESLLKWMLEKECYIEQQTVTTEILEF